MTSKELMQATAEKTCYTQVVCKEIIDAMWEILGEEIEAHGYVKVPYIGTFDVIEKKGRTNIMPDGTVVELEDRMYPRFIPSKHLRKKVRE